MLISQPVLPISPLGMESVAHPTSFIPNGAYSGLIHEHRPSYHPIPADRPLGHFAREGRRAAAAPDSEWQQAGPRSLLAEVGYRAGSERVRRTGKGHDFHDQPGASL